VELELALETKETGAVTVERFPLNGRLVLGRGPESPVALDHPLISREHIALEYQNGGLLLEDLSVNGSWLNGQSLVRGRRYRVTESDRVQLPGYELRCAIIGAPGTPVEAAEAGAPAGQSSMAGNILRSISGMEIVVALTFLAAIAISLIFMRS
jgi:predicted component of type VI protein secretion system